MITSPAAADDVPDALNQSVGVSVNSRVKEHDSEEIDAVMAAVSERLLLSNSASGATTTLTTSQPVASTPRNGNVEDGIQEALTETDGWEASADVVFPVVSTIHDETVQKIDTSVAPLVMPGSDTTVPADIMIVTPPVSPAVSSDESTEVDRSTADQISIIAPSDQRKAETIPDSTTELGQIEKAATADDSARLPGSIPDPVMGIRYGAILNFLSHSIRLPFVTSSDANIATSDSTSDASLQFATALPAGSSSGYVTAAVVASGILAATSPEQRGIIRRIARRLRWSPL